MKTWFTSDLHIGHTLVAHHRAMEAGICAPWEAPEIDAFVTAWHDRTLAALWDGMIGANDLVWVLGDISAGGSRAQRAALDWLAARPGRKRLIAGNHDGCHPMHRDSHKWQPEYLRVFESVQSAGRIRVNDHNVLLSHFPYRDDHTDTPRFNQWRLRDEGELLIHGHTHSAERKHGNELHVGVDAWGLRPISDHTVRKLIERSGAPYRTACPECGNQEATRSDGQLIPHYRGEGGRLRYPNESRCPGGFIPPDGQVVPVHAEPVKDYSPLPPTEGGLSIRALGGGLPTLGRRYRR